MKPLNHLFLLAALFVALVNGSCTKRLPEACEERDESPMEVSLSLYSAEQVLEHTLHGKENKFPVGARIGVLSNRSGEGGMSVVIEDEEMDPMDLSFTLPIGTYNGEYSVQSCVITLDDGTECPCRPTEKDADFTVTFMDTQRIVIDSLRWQYTSECNSLSLPRILIKDTQVSYSYQTEEWNDGVRFEYAFTTTPDLAYLTFNVEQEGCNFRGIDFEFTSEETDNWSYGWHWNDDQTMAVFIRER